MSIKLPEIKDLMKSGLHFGHKTARWNPKMSKYIYGVKNGIHIFDLEKIQQSLGVALEAVEETVAKGGVVLFLGTKKQARKIVKKYALEVEMPFVVEHWIGGMITNFVEIHKLVIKMEELEHKAKDVDYESKYTKRERALFKEELDNLDKVVGGIRNLKKIPDLIYVVGVKDEKTAVKEARVIKVKSLGIVDSNTDPDKVTYPIVANDDALKSIELITSLVAEAVKSGKAKISKVSAPEKQENTKVQKH
jgi:small subunit ribosomal protein S2